MIESLFATSLYKAPVAASSVVKRLNPQLLREIEDLAHDDQAGIEWSQKNYANGFTSYASANQMHKFSPTFADLELLIRKHVQTYLKSLKLQVKPRDLQMSTCWVNVMDSDSSHSLHIHPHSVISGTYYVQMPKNSSAIRFEDPRYAQFMARPPVDPGAPPKLQTHFAVPATAGDLILFESWLKHEVPRNSSKTPRISISFNY